MSLTPELQLVLGAAIALGLAGVAIACAMWWRSCRLDDEIAEVRDEHKKLRAEIAELREDFEALIEWAHGMDDWAEQQFGEPVPLDDEFPTEVSHPADTFARKEALLHQREPGRHAQR